MIFTLLRKLGLGHRFPIFDKLQLRTKDDFDAIVQNVKHPARRQELWDLLREQGMLIREWWLLIQAFDD